MDIQTALSQVAEIRGQLERARVYRGYRSTPMAMTGLVALGAAAIQERYVPSGTRQWFVEFWVAAAVVSLLLVAGELTLEYFSGMEGGDRRLTGRVVGQFLPCLAAGAVLTTVLGGTALLVSYLPGLWSILFSLGIFASRPYLPRGVGWVGVYYLVAGALLLLQAPRGVSLAPWGMGLAFGLGQLHLAAVLYWNLERRKDG